MLSNNKAKSNVEEARLYIMEILDDGERHRRKEIKEKITEMAGKDFTEGVFSGALRKIMRENDSIQIVERGVYKLLVQPTKEGISEEETSFDFEELIISTYDKMKKDINESANKINPLTVTAEQERIISILRNTMSHLNRTMKEIKQEA